jgi:pyruvate/2-oxoglutarate dehydrogenase complex dihydrolipoamide dehydrogenase (E3) component
MTTREVDLLVIGGGAGGIGAAQAAARRGATVTIVQDGPIGGDCTFTGCVPSKALLAAAADGVPFVEAMARMHAAVASIAAREDDAAMAAQGIQVRHGRAELRDARTVVVDGVALRARGIVLATGAAPVLPAIDGLDQVDPLTNETLFELTELPASLAILGGGPIGCEMAQAFARLGTEVTLVEALDRLLSKEEPAASAIVTRALVADGVDVRTGTTLRRVEPTAGGGARLVLSDGEVPEVARVLVAVGRRPVTDGLGLDAVGVATDERGFIRTADTMATNVGGLYAVGDVTGRLPFTHAANRMGLVAATNALSTWRRARPQRFDTRSIPWVTFTDPEVAHVGMYEAEAAAHGGRVAEVPYGSFDRAVAAGRTDGFLQLIAGPRRVVGNLGGGRVLGATIVGPAAGEVVHEVALAIRTGMLAGRLAQTVHAYPTWSVALQMAAAQLFFEVDGRTHRPARPH